MLDHFSQMAEDGEMLSFCKEVLAALSAAAEQAGGRWWGTSWVARQAELCRQHSLCRRIVRVLR